MINLRGQCYDGAGNMSGVRNGLVARVTQEFPKAVYTWFSSHKLNLCVVKSCHITEVRNMIDKATEVAIFFNYSPQRQRAFEEQIEIYCKENEQDTVEDKDEKRKRKKKLKMLCKTRWVERHDAYNTFTELYTPLVNTLTYIAEHSSEFISDIVKKDSSFLDGSTEVQFIATLIIAKHILSTTQILSKSLQYRNAQNIVRGWNHVKITHKRVKEIRQDVDKHHATWFSESTVMAEKVGEEPRIPGRCVRQIQRNNVPATTPSEYYKRAISIPMLDHLESEINARFTELQSTEAKGMSIVPATLCVTTTAASVKELDKNIDRLVINYMADLEDDRDLVEEEIHQWKIEWQDVAEKDRPNMYTAASALKACDKRRFPNVKRLLRILCTLPLTSAECERTFSCMRRLKSYLRSTMNAERFNGLALLATHRSKDINLINVRRRFINMHKRCMELLYAILSRDEEEQLA